MAETIVELMTDVADAIREKKGSNEPINAQSFAEEIKNLPSSGDLDIVIKPLTDVIKGATQEDTPYELTIGGKITIVGVSAFSGDKRIVKVIIGGIVNKIDINAFMGCTNNASVELLSALTHIEANAFNNNALTSIVLPSTLTNIASNAFSNNNNLSKVICNAPTPPRMWALSFENNADGRLIYVPDESVEAYKAATNWATYADAIRPMSELPNE